MADIIKKIEDEVVKVAEEVKDAVTGGAADVATDAKTVDAQAKKEAADAKAAAKQVEGTVETEVVDAATHPADITEDAKAVVTDVETEGKPLVTEGVTDAKVDVAAIQAQIKAEFEAIDSAGPGSELAEEETPAAWANRIGKPAPDPTLHVHHV